MHNIPLECHNETTSLMYSIRFPSRARRRLQSRMPLHRSSSS